MIVINFFIPPLYFMLQLAAAAPRLFMALFILLLKMILLKILPIKIIIIIRHCACAQACKGVQVMLSL